MSTPSSTPANPGQPSAPSSGDAAANVGDNSRSGSADQQSKRISDIREQLDGMLDQQHQFIAEKMQDVGNYRGQLKQSVFDDLRRYLAAHQAAVHAAEPIAESPSDTANEGGSVQSPDDEGLAQLMIELEGSGIDTEDFTTTFSKMQDLLSAHARSEHLKIQGRPDGDVLQRMVLLLAMVPGIAAGNGHSVTKSTSFTYAELVATPVSTLTAAQPDPAVEHEI